MRSAFKGANHFELCDRLSASWSSCTARGSSHSSESPRSCMCRTTTQGWLQGQCTANMGFAVNPPLNQFWNAQSHKGVKIRGAWQNFVSANGGLSDMRGSSQNSKEMSRSI